MMTPVVEVFDSASFHVCGCVPSAKSFLPLPIVIGYIHRCIRSIKCSLSKVWIKFPLPHTHRSEPSVSFSFLSCVTTSPVIQAELFHEGSNDSCDTTYFFVLLNGIATSLSVFALGQYPAKISYVLLPRRSSNGAPIMSFNVESIIWS